MQISLSWKLCLCWILLLSFSYVDSICSPGCLDSWLGDGDCDEECNNWECDLDNHDCGQCASGCFPTILGNGVCNSECNNEDCLYDYNDCQCAENCSWTEYGSCKPECLVPSCNYDKVLQYPDSWCQNTSMAIFSSYQQIIRNDFSYVVHIEDCYEASNFNCTLEKALSFADCYEECNIFECNYANGNCEFSSNPCRKSYNNSYGCLSCVSFVPFAVNALKDKGCVSINDYSYYWIFPDAYNSKEPLTDTSSAKNPHVYFVSGSAGENGDGTYFLPYQLSDLCKIHHAYAVVYLLEDGNFFLETPLAWWEGGLSSWNPRHADILLDNFKQKNIKITTLNNTKIIIKRAIDNEDVEIFWFSLKNVPKIEINNVIFDWQNTVSTCNNENYCDYCPAIVYDSASGLSYNDRGEIITDFLSTVWCQSNQNINFFEVRETNLIMNNVAFINFRSNFNSLIYVVNGNVTLNDVTFDNVKVYDGEESAVIVWYSTDNDKYDSGSLKFENGAVMRLNNGYELKDTINTKGFLYAVNITSAIFKNVEFRNNLMLKQSLTNTGYSSLLFLNFFQELWIDSCIFIYNYCDMGIIYIDQSNLFIKLIIWKIIGKILMRQIKKVNSFIIIASYDYRVSDI